MFRNLHIYTVHIKPGAKQDDLPLFIREGFNVWAFALAFFWTLYHRLWLVSAIAVAYNVGVMWLLNHEIISEGTQFALLFGQQLVMGFHANDWRRTGLAKRGYITTGIVTGESLLRAEQRYFEQTVPA